MSPIFCITAPQPSSLTFKTQWIRQRLESSTPESSCFLCLFVLQVSLNPFWTKHNFKVKSRLSGGEKEDSLNNEGPAVGVTWSAVFELWCQIARSEVVPSPEKTRDERLFSRKGNITVITLDLVCNSVNSVHSSNNYANCVMFFFVLHNQWTETKTKSNMLFHACLCNSCQVTCIKKHTSDGRRYLVWTCSMNGQECDSKVPTYVPSLAQSLVWICSDVHVTWLTLS